MASEDQAMPETALDSITVMGFKSIASVETLPLRPINVIVGANGSGKSNFLGVFAFLHAIREGRLQEYVRRAGGAEQILHFGSRVTPEIHVLLSFGGDTNRYGLSLAPTDDDSLYIRSQSAPFADQTSFPKPYVSVELSSREPELQPRIAEFAARRSGREAEISNPAATGMAARVGERFNRWHLYHMNDTSAAAPVRKTAQVNDNSFLRPDGSNLPAFLYLLQKKHPESYRLIRATVQRVAPFFDDFLLQPDRLNEETIRLVWKHKKSDQYFGASALSDGSLRFIALATLFLQPEALRPSVILVDEPELGLHPVSITLLASLVKHASVHTQVILSTQSSLLLDHFQPEDVLVADRVNEGTQLRRLDPADLAEWLQDYSLGQLWEKNELGGRPGSF